MFKSSKNYSFFVFALLLFVAILYLFYIDWKNSHKQFTFAMLDVGQGDALFIQSPTGTQILIDGGPPRKILSKLSYVMPPLDRSIDAVFITNPDQDHIGGLQDVFKYYKVGKVFESGTISGSKTYENLKAELKNKKIPEILVRNGMNIDLGGGTLMSILFPDRDVSTWPTNDGSIVAKISYGDLSIMTTGDAGIKTEKLILKNISKEKLKSTILKVGHHGSRNSTSEEFLQAVNPKYALISDGQNNKYGHPHKEILDILTKFNAKILRTDLLGNIIVNCDRINLCEIKKFKN
jgi:competence protein ComEC